MKTTMLGAFLPLILRAIAAGANEAADASNSTAAADSAEAYPLPDGAYIPTVWAPHTTLHNKPINAYSNTFLIGIDRPRTHCGVPDFGCPSGDLTLLDGSMRGLKVRGPATPSVPPNFVQLRTRLCPLANAAFLLFSICLAPHELPQAPILLRVVLWLA